MVRMLTVSSRGTLGELRWRSLQAQPFAHSTAYARLSSDSVLVPPK